LNKDKIRDILHRTYDRNIWESFLASVFPSSEFLSNPKKLEVSAPHIDSAALLGTIKLEQEPYAKNIAVFEVILGQGIILERNRVGLRNSLRKYWKEIDGAFVVFTQKENQGWRFTYISELTGYDLDQKLIKIRTEPKRFTYILGPSETCETAAQRFEILSLKGSKTVLNDIKDAFSVEKLSNEFFGEYKQRYESFCNYLNGSSISKVFFNGDEVVARDFVKKLLGRIVFLYFVQKKGWLGVQIGNNWGEGNKGYIFDLFQRCVNKENFYSEYLVPLFFETLNKKREGDIVNIPGENPCRIPYLNGGLFEEATPNLRNLVFKEELFRDLFSFFEKYNFTIYEDDPEDHIVAVDPEMLGHIFENLLEDNKDKGAYYTPKEIVHYMCRESLSEYLVTWFEGKGYEVISSSGSDSHDNHTFTESLEVKKEKGVTTINRKKICNKIDRVLIDKLIMRKLDDSDSELICEFSDEFNKALDSLKICDPAIGSGAFPMGLLQEIFSIKQSIYSSIHGYLKDFPSAETKLNIIQNSIYGVDIEKGAVDIARLRFWLSLIVDEDEPKPLPNLDYKIVVGDSLLAKLDGEVIELDWKGDETESALFTSRISERKSEIFKEIVKLQKEYFKPTQDKRKKFIEIRDLKIDLLITQLDFMIKKSGMDDPAYAKDSKHFDKYLTVQGWLKTRNNLYKIKKDKKEQLNYFDWKLDFPEIMNEQIAENVGFDIVIGNPPFIDSVKMTQIMPDYRNELKNRYRSANGNWDLYVVFVERGLSLLKNWGKFTFIIPNKILSVPYAITVREILSKLSIKEIRDYSSLKVFASAAVYPVTLLVTNTEPKNGQGTFFTSMHELETIRYRNNIVQSEFRTSSKWSKYLSNPTSVKIIHLLNQFPKLSQNYKQAIAASTVSEAYILKNLLINDQIIEDGFKFINTGTIDKWQSLWGDCETQYIKDKYRYPWVPRTKLKVAMQNRLEQANQYKLIIAGMAKEFEVFPDLEGKFFAGKSTVILIESIENIKVLATILNSPLASFILNVENHGFKMSGGYITINSDMINNLPVPLISSNLKLIIARLVDYLLLLLRFGNGRKNAIFYSSLLKRLLNALIYELYLPQIMTSSGLFFAENLSNIDDIAMITINEKKEKIVFDFCSNISRKDSKINSNLFMLNTIPAIAHIEMNNENI
jgi:hypothetical protein